MALFVPKDRKSLFRQFLAGMYDAVVITDATGHVIETNARTEEFFGFTSEQMLDWHISRLVAGLTPEVVRRIRRGLDEDRHVVVDANGTHKNGTRFACEIAITSVEHTEPDDLVFTIRNVERRRQVRDMLRAKESAFEIAHAALFACDATGLFTQVNQSFIELFGLADSAEARTRRFSELLDDAPLLAAFRCAVSGETTTVDVEAESDGEASGRRKTEVTLSPDRRGRKIVGVVGSIVRI